MRLQMLVPVVLVLVAIAPDLASADSQTFGGADVVPTFECFAPGGEQLVEVGNPQMESYAVPFSGVITSWVFVAGPEVESQIRLKVFRPTGVPSDFLTVGESAAVAPTANISSVFPTSIPVHAGDVLGLRIVSNQPTDCGVPTEGFDDLLRLLEGPNPAVGTMVSMPIGTPGVRLTVGATVETDVDGDGLADDTQDSDDDGDGVPDTADSCPVTAAATADGCPIAPPPAEPTPPLTVTTPPITVPTPPTTDTVTAPAPPPPPPTPALTLSISSVPSSIKLTTLRSKGLSITATPSVAASLLAELRATVKGASIARAGDLQLAERSLTRASGKRKFTLTVSSSQRSRLHTKAKLTLRLTATDSLGRAKTVTRSVKVT